MEDRHSRVGDDSSGCLCYRPVFDDVSSILDRHHKDHGDNSRYSRGRDRDRERSRDDSRRHERHREHDYDRSRTRERVSDRDRESSVKRREVKEAQAESNAQPPPAENVGPSAKQGEQLPDYNAAAIAAMEAAKKLSLSCSPFRAVLISSENNF